MKQCEKCQTENYDEAAYCKNCGHTIEMGKTNQVVKFQTTYCKLNIITVWSFRVLMFAIPLFSLSISIYIYYYSFLGYSDLWEALSVLFGMPLVSFPILILSFIIYNKRWSKFYLNSDLKNAGERLTAFAFSQNKSEESVKIRENTKGELQLKDKPLGAKGYFHLVTDKEGHVLLIGEKYNTQNLIRTVFGKEINFIEK